MISLEQILLHLRAYAYEYAIFLSVCCVGFAFAWFVHTESLTRVFPDQNAHLNIARQISDSRTPGLSQLGHWPPILHALVFPFAQNNYLYESGLAAAVAIVPIIALSSVFLYWIVISFSSRPLLAGVIVAIYVLNPYFLYYAVTPMSESLFIALLIILAYWLLRWMETESLAHLTILALLTATASLARFEGLMLIPAIVAVMLYVLVVKRTWWSKLEATLILFLTLASLGVAFILIHGWIYAGNPFEFATGRWSASAQAEGVETATSGSVVLSGKYAMLAASLMLGPMSELIALFCVAIMILTPFTHRTRLSALLFLGAAPFALLILSLWNGDAFISFPNLPPFDPYYYNERYGLQAYPFMIFGLLATMIALESRIRMSPLFSRSSLSAATILVFVALFSQLSFFGMVAGVDKLSLIRGTIDHSVVPLEEDAGRFLGTQYQGGGILMTRALNHGVSVAAGIPLKEYIYEGNVPAYPETNKTPWKYARYVIMQNQDIQWRKENDFVALRWKNSDEFDKQYELLFENGAALIFERRSDRPVYLSTSL